MLWVRLTDDGGEDTDKRTRKWEICNKASFLQKQMWSQPRYLMLCHVDIIAFYSFYRFMCQYSNSVIATQWLWQRYAIILFHVSVFCLKSHKQDLIGSVCFLYLVGASGVFIGITRSHIHISTHDMSRSSFCTISVTLRTRVDIMNSTRSAFDWLVNWTTVSYTTMTGHQVRA